MRDTVLLSSVFASLAAFLVGTWFVFWPQTIVSVPYSEEIKTYRVYGMTHREVGRSLRIAGRNATGVIGAVGRFSAHRSFDYKRTDTGVACWVKSTHFKLTGTIIMPKWVHYDSVGSTAKSAWDAYAAYILDHERIHAEAAQDAMNRIRDAVIALPPFSSCKGLDDAIQRIVTREIRLEDRQQLAIDRNEGAVCYPTIVCNRNRDQIGQTPAASKLVPSMKARLACAKRIRAQRGDHGPVQMRRHEFLQKCLETLE